VVVVTGAAVVLLVVAVLVVVVVAGAAVVVLVVEAVVPVVTAATVDVTVVAVTVVRTGVVGVVVTVVVGATVVVVGAGVVVVVVIAGVVVHIRSETPHSPAVIVCDAIGVNSNPADANSPYEVPYHGNRRFLSVSPALEYVYVISTTSTLPGKPTSNSASNIPFTGAFISTTTLSFRVSILPPATTDRNGTLDPGALRISIFTFVLEASVTN